MTATATPLPAAERANKLPPLIAARLDRVDHELGLLYADCNRSLDFSLPDEILAVLHCLLVRHALRSHPNLPAGLLASLRAAEGDLTALVEMAQRHEPRPYAVLTPENLVHAARATKFVLAALSAHQSGATPLLHASSAARALLNAATEERTDGQKRLLRALADDPIARPAAELCDPASVMRLACEFPNFGAVVEFYAGQVALRQGLRALLPLPPVLLTGAPGIGKTRFAAALAAALGLEFEAVPMNTQTGGFILSGLDAGWSSGKPGRVFNRLRQGKTRNPLMLLDEVDKTSGDAKHDPLGPLYELLEPETARRFVDEFLGLPLDASGVVWIATANDIGQIPEPVRSRFAVFEIAPPDAGQMRAIAGRMLQELAGGADATLDEEARASLDQVSVRELRLMLQQGLGRAALRRTSPDEALAVSVQDLMPAECKRRRSMGFVDGA